MRAGKLHVDQAEVLVNPGPRVRIICLPARSFARVLPISRVIPSSAKLHVATWQRSRTTDRPAAF